MKRGVIRLGLLTTLYIMSSHLLYAQVHNFEIRFGSHAIGTVAANCKTSGSTKNILIQSRVQMRLLSKFNLDISCEYNNNVLVQAKAVRNTGRASDDKSTATRREGRNYIIVQNGQRSVLNNTEIVHSVADLYFNEPRQVARIFSETLGRFLALKALGNGEYELSLPEGKKNIYKYEKGALVEVEINHTFGRAYIVRVT